MNRCVNTDPNYYDFNFDDMYNDLRNKFISK